jgi:hypothetical protein
MLTKHHHIEPALKIQVYGDLVPCPTYAAKVWCLGTPETVSYIS